MADAFISLARKWRPRRLQDMVGQEYVVRALQNAVRQNRLHHALLFSGTRGIGKTTLARIMAMLINCPQRAEDASEPCLQCDFCQDIMAGRLTDVIEQDAASHTQVDKMRELLESAAYAPARAPSKVFIIDEVHMLTKQSFNAMLKTLEEPPPRVHFILATTDPQKVLATVRSRCLCFSLQPLSHAQIAARLAHILQEENIPFDAGATNAVARLAAGSMRDALSILDQAVAHREGELRADDVRRITGDLGVDMLADILRAVASNDANQIHAITQAHQTRHAGFDLSLERLAALIYKIALAQAASAAPPPDDPDEQAIISEMQDKLSPEQLQTLYEIAVRARRQLPMAPDEPTGFAMALLRMTLFVPDKQRAGGAAPAAPASASAPSAPAPAAPPPAASAAAPAAAEPAASATAAAAQPVAAASTGPDGWRQTADKLGTQARALAMHCVADHYDASGVELSLDAAQAALKDRFLPQLEKDLRRLHGDGFLVTLRMAKDNAADAARKDELLTKARDSAFTREVLSQMPNARLLEDSVRAVH